MDEFALLSDLMLLLTKFSPNRSAVVFGVTMVGVQKWHN